MLDLDEDGGTAPRAASREAQIAEIDGRTLGRSPGVLRLDTAETTAVAVAAMAHQARRGLSLLTPDLEPHLYDRLDFVHAVRRLAVARAGHLPVRLLLIDADAAAQHGLRLIELARRLTSAIQIGVVPQELAEQCDAFLLADEAGYRLRRRQAPRQSLIDFADPGQVRALRRTFDDIWQQCEPAAALRRLHL